MARIFLCYRSGDDAYAAVLLDEKLSEVFGRNEVFRASRSIEPGESYSEVIGRALKECDTMLVIIGPRWAESIGDADGRPESAGQDWVRTEISTALGNDVRVIPLLLSRTPRLDPQHLPRDIADLANRQYLMFDHRNITGCLDQLIAALRTRDRTP